MIFFLRSIQAALVAFTRLPFSSPNLQPAHFRYAHYFLPVIGLFIGICLALASSVLTRFLPHAAAIIIVMIVGILLTGALHEDGFADCCDGFGGGHSPANILDIMKDSRLGSYGVIGLISLLGLKFALLHAITPPQLANALISSALWGRISPLLLMHMIPRIQGSNTKMSNQFHLQPLFLLISVGFALACAAYLYSPGTLIGLFVATCFVCVMAATYFNHRLKGYNGDCLGAIEQISEVMTLLILSSAATLAISP